MVVKLRWLWVVIPLLLILLAAGGYYYYIEEIRVIPEELVRESLENSLYATSYRYKAVVTLKLDGQEERQLSDVAGEKSGRNFHFKGKMLGQKVEVYQVDDSTYSLDPKTGRWMITPGNELFQPEIFMMEINPMSNFRFTEINNIEYHGLEKVGRKKYYMVSCEPVVKNNFIEKYWQDFHYRLWVDKRSRRIVRAEIYAKSIKDPQDSINISVELSDFNKRITIKPPEAN